MNLRIFSRFTLRTYLIVITLLCAGFAYFTHRLYRAREQERAVNFISSGSFCFAYYDYQCRHVDGERPHLLSKDPAAQPCWLAQKIPWLGVDFFHDVISVGYRPPRNEEVVELPFDRAELARSLKQFPRLRRLYVDPDHISAQDLRDLPARQTIEEMLLFYGPCDEEMLCAIGTFRRLKFVKFVAKELTDSGWQAICELPELTELSVIEASLSDQNLRQLTRRTELQELSFNGDGISPEGWRALRSFPKLTSIHIHGGRNVDEVFRSLAHSPDLISIGIEDCDLTDEGLATLGLHSQLEDFSVKNAPRFTGTGFPAGDDWPAVKVVILENRPISDAGLAKIARLPKLRTLWLDRAKVTESGICATQWCAPFQEFRSETIALGDNGLRHLATFPGIQGLNFPNNDYHEEVRQELLSANPKLFIEAAGLRVDALAE